MQLSEVTAKNIADFPKFAATTAKRIAKARGHEDSNGSRGFNMAIDAMNFLWVIAERDSHATSNPILKLTRKKRAKGARHGVPSEKLNEFVQAAGSGGKDPRLDYLIAWFLCETAARRAFGWNPKTNLTIAVEGECLIVSVSSTPTTHSLDESGRFLLPKWTRELLGSSSRVLVMSSYVMEAPVVTISSVESVASALQHYRGRNI